MIYLDNQTDREHVAARITQDVVCLILRLLVLNKKTSKTMNSAPYGKANAFVQKLKR